MASRISLKRSSVKHKGRAPTAIARRRKPASATVSGTAPADKQKVYDLLEELPAESLTEILLFAEFLRSKAGPRQRKRPIRLAGIWAGVPLDGVEEEIRRLRRESLEHLEQEVMNGTLSR